MYQGVDRERHASNGFGDAGLEEGESYLVRWVGEAPAWTEHPAAAEALESAVAVASLDADLWRTVATEPATPLIFHVSADESGSIPALRRSRPDAAIVLDLTEESTLANVRKYLRRAAAADLTLVDSRASLRELRRRRPVLAATTALLPRPVELDRFVPRQALDAERAHGLEELRARYGLRERVILCPTLPGPSGLELAVACLELLRGRGRDLSLVVLPNREDPRSWARSRAVLKQAGAVIVDGIDPDDLPLVYAAADVVCLPARNARTSEPARLAAAAGVPVVASESEPYLEVVEDGVTGYLLPVDDVSSLAGAIAHILSDDVRARRLGTAAREHAEREWSPGLIARRLVELWRGCAGVRAPRVSTLGSSRS